MQNADLKARLDRAETAEEIAEICCIEAKREGGPFFETSPAQASGPNTTGDRSPECADIPRVLSPLERKAPSLYDFRTGKWNHKGLRISAVYRLLRKQIIGKNRALELLAEKHTPAEMKILRGTVEHWHAYPIKHMLP